MRSVTILLTVALTVSTTMPAQSQGDPLSKADFVLGELQEGLDSTIVRARLGKPDSVVVDSNPFDVGAKLVQWRYRHVTVDFFSTNMVVGLSTRDPVYPTHRGLRVGDPVERLKELYGEPSGSYEDSLDYDDPNERLHVVRITVRNGRVAEIYLGSILD